MDSPASERKPWNICFAALGQWSHDSTGATMASMYAMPLTASRWRLGPIETQTRAPVVDDQGDVVGDATGREQPVKVPPVFDEAIAPGSGIIELVRVSHADQVRCDDASESFGVGHDVPPEKGGGGVAVKEQDGVAFSLINAGHGLAQHCDALLFVTLHP